MTGGSSPVSGPRGMRRLVPDLCGPDAAGLPDQSSIAGQVNSFQEISLTEPEDSNDLGQKQDE